MGLVFWSGLVGKFCLGITYKVAVKLSGGVQSSEGLTGAKGPISRELTPKVSKLVPVVGRRPHCLSIGCLSVLITQ